MKIPIGNLRGIFNYHQQLLPSATVETSTKLEMEVVGMA